MCVNLLRKQRRQQRPQPKYRWQWRWRWIDGRKEEKRTKRRTQEAERTAILSSGLSNGLSSPSLFFIPFWIVVIFKCFLPGTYTVCVGQSPVKRNRWCPKKLAIFNDMNIYVHYVPPNQRRERQSARKKRGECKSLPLFWHSTKSVWPLCEMFS